MFGLPESLINYLGLACIIYAACRLLRLWSLSLEDSCKKHTILEFILTVFRLILGFFALPVCIVFNFFETQTIKRIERLHDREISSLHSDYIKKCAYCRSQNNYEYYEPEEKHHWDPIDPPDY